METLRTALGKNKGTAIATVLLLFLGFVMGAIPSVRDPILESAQEIDTSSFEDVLGTTGRIYMNNAFIAAICTIGGLVLIPTLYYGIFGVGAVYGALASSMGATEFFFIMGSFGILEVLALFFSILGGLLFPKYIASKLLRHPADLKETASTSLFFLIVSGAILVPSALLEACLLYASYFAPSLILGVLGFGFFITFLIVYSLLR